MNKSISFLVSLGFCFNAMAGLLSTEPGPHKIDGFSLAKSASFNLEGKNTSLGALGSGIRQKKVLFVNVKVYVAEMFSSEPASFLRSEAEALASLDKSVHIAMRLHFLRDVTAEKIQSSFKEALTANKIDLLETSIASFLKEVSLISEIKEGKNLSLLFSKNVDGTETLTFEDGSDKITKIVGAKGFTKNLMSIWLGTPSDDGIQKLKQSLLLQP